jgi:hypothetical protein
VPLTTHPDFHYIIGIAWGWQIPNIFLSLGM